ncbi:hypothetical protein J6590_035669 [Homalodisca vitripennis]|nr:hypothetical protein J6590_035669 [Homalodisca vitripennis]
MITLAEVYSRIKGVRIIEINQTGTYRKIFAIMRSRLHKMFKPLFRQTKQQEIEEEEKGLGKNNYYDSSYDSR